MWGALVALSFLASADAAELTLFARKPEVRAVFGANPDTVVTTTSTNQVDCTYDVSHGGWSGVTFNFDDFGTPEYESVDFSPDTNVVLTVSGTPRYLLLEIEDVYTNKAKFLVVMTNQPRTYLLSSNFVHQYFPKLDWGKIRFYSHLTTPDYVGDGCETGSFRILCRGGLPFIYRIQPETTGALTTIPGNPPVVLVGGANGDTVIGQTQDWNFTVSYDVSTGGWSGATILFDDYGTGPFESQDLSPFPLLVFALTGTASTLKFEIEDTAGRRLNAFLDGVSGGMKYYSVDTSIVASQGVDVARTRFINFVVDKQLAGGGTAGAFRVTCVGPSIDTDGDRLPDHIELQYGLNPHSTGGGNGQWDDPDHDGVPNFTEIVAGTSPVDPNSNPDLRLDLSPVQIALSLQGAAGRKYRFYVRDDLKTGSWTQIGSIIQPPTNGIVEQTYTPPAGSPRLYYRARITRDGY